MSHDIQMSAQPIFRGLADPTRREIVTLLARESRSVSEIAGQFPISRNAIVKHLRVLEDSGLVVTETSGRERINHLDPHGLKLAFDWLSDFNQFWDAKLLDLKTAVEEDVYDTPNP
jgi:DNA-binding transcriptional ArsR family regulator